MCVTSAVFFAGTMITRLFEANGMGRSTSAVGAELVERRLARRQEDVRLRTVTDLRGELVRAADDDIGGLVDLLGDAAQRRGREDDERLVLAAAPGERDHGREQGEAPHRSTIARSAIQAS